MVINMKKIISYILLIFWMIVIFLLSHQTSDISGGASGSLIYDTLYFICNIFSINTVNLNEFIEIIHEPVREAMHALEYLILGILTINALYQSEIRKNIIIISIIFCFAYSLIDEIHQIFIDGRTFQLFDLFMDAIGYIIGTYFSKILIFKK